MEKLTILGIGSALPASGRNPTAQVLEHNGKFFLIDCGEGTQSRLRENHLSFDKITHIFISHLHGDHYLGLPGLISTMQLLGRTRELHIYGPEELWGILKVQFKASKTWITFPVHFNSISEESILFETDSLICSSIELNHRISCFGFKFQEKEKPRRINGSRVKDVNVPHYFMSELREGKDYINDLGLEFKNEELTLPPRKSNCYAFCSDNRIKDDFSDKLKGVNVLYHESTFLHQDLDRAQKTYHTTARESAELAKKCGVEFLILGHYSARYNDLTPILEEAKKVFENSILGKEKMVFDFTLI